MSQQIETQIDVTLTERNRMSALFRIILVVPMAIFVASFAPTDLSTSNSNYLSVGFLILPTALAIIVRQIYPTYLLAFNEALLSLQTRVDAYLLMLTDEYPSIEENDVVSVTFPEVDAKALNRWFPLIKWFLAIPLYLVGVFYIVYLSLLTIAGWFSVLFTGNYPEKCAEGVVGTIAYWNRVIGYAFLMVTDEYPSFSL
jgi:Mn2+/Fe2+ NRAMP family transporter